MKYTMGLVRTNAQAVLTRKLVQNVYKTLSLIELGHVYVNPNGQVIHAKHIQAPMATWMKAI